MRTIVLYGMRGTGKSTVGRLLAEKLNYSFLDLDNIIADKNNQKLPDYIKNVGWDEFRDEENRCLKELLEKESSGKRVVSLGGGTMAFERNRVELFKNKNTKIIYLDTNLAEIHRRISQDEENGEIRNVLTDKTVLEELEEVYTQREDIYKNSCDFSVDNNGTIECSIEQIIRKINYGGICIPVIDFKNIYQFYKNIKDDRKVEYIELRIDFLEDIENLEKLIKLCPKKIICTNRAKSEGGEFPDTADESISILKKCLDFGANYIDIELDKLGNIHIENKEFLLENNKNLILSHHNFKRTLELEDLKKVLERMKQYSPAVYKIAMMPENKDDITVIYKLQEYFNENNSGEKSVFISMGKLGEKSRIDLPKKGSIFTFGSYGENFSAPGQIEYKKLYKKVFENKEVLFLGGAQISGSLSPFMHNLSSNLLKTDENKFLYKLRPVKKQTKSTAKNFVKLLESDEKYLGGNVTMPYKIEMYNYLNSANRLDTNAQLVGAVNTLYKKNGKIRGTNTDIDGVKLPILEKIGNVENKYFHSLSSYILGAGGASRAVIAAMIQLGIKNIYVFNRSQESLDEIEKHFKIFLGEGQQITTKLYDVENGDKLFLNLNKESVGESEGQKIIIVNTLPFGFNENLPKSPINFEEIKNILSHLTLYFEAVYDSKEGDTPIVKEILKNNLNIEICRGIEMLIAQAQKGFELWSEGGEFQMKRIKKILLK